MRPPADRRADEPVIPGNIIVRQRGTHFHPGQHVRSPASQLSLALADGAQVKMGRDHTIYAVVPGFVRFYTRKFGLRDRRYIGVVLHRGETLPRDEAALGRSRYFGFLEVNGVQTPTITRFP